MKDVYVETIMMNGHLLIASIDFPKESFNIIGLISWLRLYKIKVMSDKETYIDKAHSVDDAIKFRGTPIVLYKKGTNDLTIFREHLPEFGAYMPKTIYTRKPEMKIMLGGVEIEYIPEIEIDSTKDLIISNGNIIVADYVGDYDGSIGFFENKGDDLPVPWIYDPKEVNIQVYLEGGGRVFIFLNCSNRYLFP